MQITVPSSNLRGGLAPVDALGEQATRNLGEQDPLQLNGELVWHLRGTKAATVIHEVRKAVSDFNLHCLTLWLELAKKLSELSGLPVLPWEDWQDQDRQPRIFHYLVDNAYKEVFRAAAGSGLPAPDWPLWSFGSDSEVLSCNHTECVVGGPMELEKVKEAVQELIDHQFQTYLRQARELDMLFRDLQFLQNVMDETLSQVDIQMVSHGICPGCPYPEAARPHENGVLNNQEA